MHVPHRNHRPGKQALRSRVEIIVNDQPQQVPDGATVAQLLDHLGFGGRPVAVEVNLELVAKRVTISIACRRAIGWRSSL